MWWQINQGAGFRLRGTVLLLSTVTCLLTPACGFSPMHGTAFNGQSTAIQSNLSNVNISNIPDREGQYLRNLLIDRFYRDGRPVAANYQLNITRIKESLIDLDITKTADSTRGQLRLTTAITLIDKQSGEEILNRDLHAITSYNILSSEFSTRISEQSARENALGDLARQIEMQVSLALR